MTEQIDLSKVIGGDGMTSQGIGIVGAGHLGVALASRLIDIGFDRGNVWLGHRGSQKSHATSAAAGVEDRLVDVNAVMKNCDVIFYTVRPIDYRMISDYELREGQTVISFLAGVSLSRLSDAARGPGLIARAIISAPDTISSGQALGATCGDASESARKVLKSVVANTLNVRSENQVEPVTVLGTCLPFILMYCEFMRVAVSDRDILKCAGDYGLDEWAGVIDWARRVRPRGLNPGEIENYVSRCATPGGIAEKIINSLRLHRDFARTVREGIEHAQTMLCVQMEKRESIGLGGNV
ncbi:pyrroline-5-carboxylate reductase family protein [Burkholderia sp. MSMB1498]|uniref:pyrroline-5-carboxylate reductase family protein n=1 Tax=Burkholderia sp. MSMB1498 TaxID=1637842 RepID=UPI0007542A36|nr:NAD(P)-binding domain-containing protein [Burkholderia sp. MSMB1498]KVK75468.1 ProC [Burkholderia sp. MSMB1498]